jgi:hypothetical protein
LEETCERYLDYVHPMLTEAEYEETKRVVGDFVQSGQHLQEKLIARDADSPLTSYVKPFWDHMYLGGRYPVPINSNPGLLLSDDPGKRTQAGRAASLTYYSLKWLQGYRDGSLRPDFNKQTRLCMGEYSLLFSLSRIPAIAKDFYSQSPDSRHIVIIRGERIYTLVVFDEEGRLFPEAFLEQQMQALIDANSVRSGGHADFLGTLTACDRDFWAGARQELVSSSAINKASLASIDSAIFVVTLDFDGPTDLTAWMNQTLAGHGNHRWFDKSFQIHAYSGSDGRAGVNFEHRSTALIHMHTALIHCTHTLYSYAVLIHCTHTLYSYTALATLTVLTIPTARSPFDGATIVRFLDDMWADAQALPMPSGTPAYEAREGSMAGGGAPELLGWSFSEATRAHLTEAAERWALLVGAININGLEFKHFGKGEIKTWKQSPDGVIQMAYQLAYYRMHGTSRISVYESASTKQFLSGRTEAIRR